MTPTPTPDPTTDAAARFTVEQIAGEPMCRCEGCGMFWMPEYPGNDETCIECGGTISQEPSHVLMEIGAHAALRDRLARAEARERELRAAGVRVLTSWDQEDEPDIVDAFEALRDVLGNPDTSRRDGLSSLAPTDGAARAGDEGATP
jgi:hypothetical protein